MEEETKLETPEESADRLCDCVRGKGGCAGL